MATTRLPMRHLREIFRQKLVLGLAHRAIAQSVGVSLGAVATALSRARAVAQDFTGYGLLYKRLERGTFRIPTVLRPGDKAIALDAGEFAKILEGLDLSRAKVSVGITSGRRSSASVQSGPVTFSLSIRAPID